MAGHRLRETNPARSRYGSLVKDADWLFPNPTRALNAAGHCSLVLFVEEGFQAGIACAADGKAYAVREDCHFAVFAVGLDARDALEVDEVGAVDTHEESRVKRQFEARDCLLFQMLFSFCC